MKNSPCIRGPTQFEPELFDGQLHLKTLKNKQEQVIQGGKSKLKEPPAQWWFPRLLFPPARSCSDPPLGLRPRTTHWVSRAKQPPRKKPLSFPLSFSVQRTWKRDPCQQESVNEIFPFFLLPFLPKRPPVLTTLHYHHSCDRGI